MEPSTSSTHAPHQPGSALGPGDRFSIQRRLGAGGMGVVYEAYDRERGQIVALKTLASADADAVYRFKREFRALADVSHPNLVALYELVADGPHWLLAMERIDGVDFLQHVRGPSSGTPARSRPEPGDAQATRTVVGDLTATAAALLGERAEQTVETLASVDGELPAGADHAPAYEALSPAGIDRLRRALVQLVEGARALHAHGILHGDLKPSNVLVDDGRRVVLLDFGIVRQLSGSGDRIIAGTPAYVAPEVGTGESLTAAADWYSLGVMLFEALTGSRPFSGSAATVLRRKRQVDAPAPASLAPGVPDDLGALCARLLSRRPADRPGAAEILAALGDDPETHAPVEHVDVDLVGRQQHLQTLREHLDRTRAGEPITVLVHGSSGMGKSALVERFLTELRDAPDAVVIAGRCYEGESVPHKALDSAIDALADYLAGRQGDEISALLPDDIHLLARVFPVLGRVAAIRARLARVDSADPLESRRRAFEALRALFERLARRGPVVLYIDDAQWGDRDSARLLAEVFGPPAPPAVLLVLGYRTEEAETSALLAARHALPGRHELRVGPLSGADSRTLARALLEQCGAETALAPTIARESEGSPLFIAELARSAVGRDQHRALTLDAVVRSRIAALAPPARELLGLLATAGQPLPLRVALRAADAASPREIKALCVAHLARLRMTRGEDGIEPYHDRIRETATAALAPDERRSHHRALANVLASEGADAELLATHWEAAGERERAAHHYRDAAERASAALAFDHAATLYQQAIDSKAWSDGEREALHAALGDALANAGRGAAAAAAYKQAAGFGPAEAEILYQSQAAEQLLRCGHIDDGLVELRSVVTGLGLRIPRGARGSLASFLWQRLRVRLRGYRAVQRDAAEIDAPLRRRLDLFLRTGTALMYTDTRTGLTVQFRHLLAALRAGDPGHLVRALGNEAAFVALRGVRARDAVGELSRRAHAIADATGDEIGTAFALHGDGMGHYQFGEFGKARTALDRAAALFRSRAGHWFEVATVEMLALSALYYLGEVAELRRRVRQLLREAEARSDLFLATGLCIGRPNLGWLAVGGPDSARAVVDEAVAGWASSGYHMQHFFAYLARCNAGLHAGPGAAAWELTAGEWPRLERSVLMRIQSLRVEARHLRARAAIAAAADRAEPELLAIAEADTAQLEREDSVLAHVAVPLHRAGVAGVRGRPEDAAAQLRVAADRAAEADMGLYAAAARYRLGALLGGDEGAALIAAAERWMRDRSVEEPARMANVFVPGW